MWVGCSTSPAMYNSRCFMSSNLFPRTLEHGGSETPNVEGGLSRHLQTEQEEWGKLKVPLSGRFY